MNWVMKCALLLVLAAGSIGVEAAKRLKASANLFACAHCGHGFVREAELERHEPAGVGIFPFECTICNFAVARYDGMCNHLRTSHRLDLTAAGCEKYVRKIPYLPISCGECDQEYTSLHELLGHWRSAGHASWRCGDVAGEANRGGICPPADRAVVLTRSRQSAPAWAFRTEVPGRVRGPAREGRAGAGDGISVPPVANPPVQDPVAAALIDDEEFWRSADALFSNSALWRDADLLSPLALGDESEESGSSPGRGSSLAADEVLARALQAEESKARDRRTRNARFASLNEGLLCKRGAR